MNTLKGEGIITRLQKKLLQDIASLQDTKQKKDPGFDLYWFAAALVEVEKYPDDIAKWPVDLVIEIDAKLLKETFLELSREIMGRIKEST